MSEPKAAQFARDAQFDQAARDAQFSQGAPPPGREMIRQTLIELLEADTGEKYPDLDEKTPLREGLGLDSVDVVSIVSQIERRFRIRLTHEELQTLVTVGDVLALLQSKVSAGPETKAA